MRHLCLKCFWLVGSLLVMVPLTIHPVAAQEQPTGVVVAIGGVDLAPVLAGVESAGGASWRSVRVDPTASGVSVPPMARLDRLEQLYADADFLGCLTASQNAAIQFWTLLQEGHREAAARATVFGAACAFGAGDEDLAQTLLSRGAVVGLDLAGAGANTTPEFQLVAERTIQRVAAQPRVAVTLTTAPYGATVLVDGGAAVCRSDRCELNLRRGEHVIKATKIGHLPRIVHIQLNDELEREVALDSAPATEQQRQASDALARGWTPDREDLAETLANGFGARLVVIAWQEAGMTRLGLFDHALNQMVARESCEPNATALRIAGHSVVTQWRGIAEPTPLVRRPVFWIVVSAVAAVVATGVGLGVWAASRPVETQNDLVFVNHSAILNE
jgi:hypothetical protein